MNSADWPAIETLYLDVLNLPAPDRPAWLQTCGAPPHIRAEVESLLAAEESAGDFLLAPPAHLAADLIALVPSQLESGQRIGRYTIEAMITKGGMGEVYRARKTETNEPIALKLLRRHMAFDPGAASRFEREAQATLSLNHPNIVTVHEFGDSDAGRFIAMEWVDGHTWRHYGVRQTNEAISWSLQAAQALAAAHASGITHRDIKPDNLMTTPDGQVKILDFGLARLSGQIDITNEANGASGTISGTLSGTLPYMSPEVLLGETATPASDIFSFGSVLYELFTGRHPFAGETPLDIFEAIECSTPDRPQLCPALSDLLLAMLDRDPAKRPTASSVATRLLQLQADHHL